MKLESILIDLEPYQIRSFRLGDELSLQQAANDPEVARWLRDVFPSPYTMDDAADWVAYAGNQSPQTELAIVLKDRVIGTVGFRIQDDMLRRSAEVGYWIARSHWGRGIATRALGRIVDYAFGNFDVNRLYAGIKDGNEGSGKVLQVNGFRFEGRMREAITSREGETKDELIFGLLKSDHMTLRKSAS